MTLYNECMPRFTFCAIALVMLALVLVSFTSVSHADAILEPNAATSPYDLIAAVNALRLAYGLPAYDISSILMSTAQNQADYMAVTGSVSHTGAGGSSVTDRLLEAGYPLAGQLSLGGFRSENITAGNETMSAQAVVDQWKGDSVHLTTMISPDLTEMGAGVSVSNGRAYFVIDCARPTTNGVPQDVETSIAAGTSVPTGGAGVILPVIVATPNADGDLIHEVQAGQSLWQIAIAYDTKIEEIKRLNGLSGNDIYPGTKLLIRKGVVLTPASSPATMAVETVSTVTGVPRSVATMVAPTHIVPSTSEGPPKNITGSVLGILALACIGGWLFAMLGNSKT